MLARLGLGNRDGWAWLATLAVALTFGGLLLQRAISLWPFTVDDTYITLQYARHLATGHGPAWNIGGPPTEGYTTVLWMLVLSAIELCGVDGVLGAKLSSMASAFAAIGLAAWLAWACSEEQRPAARRIAVATTFALAAGYWKWAVHAVSGMETTFTAALVTGFCLAVVRAEARPTARAFARLALLGLGLTLARPEAALLAGVSWLVLWLRLEASARWSLLTRTLGFAVLPGALYFAARYAYFGLAFPLPFYVKAAGHGGLAGLSEVALFFADLFRTRPFIPPLLIASTFARPRRALAPLAGASAMALFFTVPSHIMGFESRYLMPILPVLFAAAGVGAGAAASWLTARSPGSERWLPGSLLAALLALAWLPYPAGLASSTAHWRAYGAGLGTAHLALAADLNRHAALADKRVIAMLDVGAVAYRSSWTVIDTYGLNDARVALSRRSDVPYIFAQSPDLVVLVSEFSDRFRAVFDWEEPIAAHARQAGFVPVKSYPFEADYHLALYARAGSPLAAALTLRP